VSLAGQPCPILRKRRHTSNERWTYGFAWGRTAECNNKESEDHLLVVGPSMVVFGPGATRIRPLLLPYRRPLEDFHETAGSRPAALTLLLCGHTVCLAGTALRKDRRAGCRAARAGKFLEGREKDRISHFALVAARMVHGSLCGASAEHPASGNWKPTSAFDFFSASRLHLVSCCSGSMQVRVRWDASLVWRVS